MRARPAQRGAALLAAMIVVTLVASLAAAMVWRQYRAVQIEAAERSRAQAAWILQGALDWSRLILLEDARANQTEPVDHLGEVWAVPLADTKLSTFLAGEQATVTDEGPEAYLSGHISDAQAQYNLRNLGNGDQIPPLELRTLQRLCDAAGVSGAVATQLATQLHAALNNEVRNLLTGNANVADQPLQPQNMDQLVWLGLSPDSVERLKPFVTLLPQPTPVNLNTAPAEVIAALFDGMDLGAAQSLVQSRASHPLRNVQEAARFLPQGQTLAADRSSVNSSFFIVEGRLRLEDRVLQERSLIQRVGLDMQVLARDRVNLMAAPP